ncbi:hypothetical protein OGAPHI_004670 [Ogataea philodendri]|uniref:Uncharacterized protein n=1 Tax=Ogataea philodendri TaxID=1378263 RepID=A0A9P8P2R5_9ASCO|nr:uncharacterized protein OGAPHI_004670 [Ogataea philodendri]KAH3663956.1 hypothetical protein OGAPHI_004670 [Ogataea philodendri]
MMSAFDELMELRGKPAENGEVEILGHDPVYKTPFKLGETTAQVLAACGVAATDLWELKTGHRQKVTISVDAAAASLADTKYSFKKEADGNYYAIPGSDAMKHMVSLTQPWETKDGKYFLPHTNLKHLEARVLKVLDCKSEVESVKAAIRERESQELEDSIAAARACGGIVRTPEEWLEHPQGKYLASRPVVEIAKIGDSPPEPLPKGNKPLSGIRVLDLTRILAGPVCGLTLAELGADVLMVTAPHLPQVFEFVRDTSHGKRSCFLDLNKEEDSEKLKELASTCDIFIDGYRPGRVAEHFLSIAELAKLRPGVIHISVNCFGSGGPFGDRAGWDQVAQAVTGMCHTQGNATNNGIPQLTPVYACDYICGRLGAYGALIALKYRYKTGGSYSVKVSLCQAAMLCQRQGYLDNFGRATGVLPKELFEKYQVFEDDTSYGDLNVLGPVIGLSETPCEWSRKTPQLGQDSPEWL